MAEIGRRLRMPTGVRKNTEGGFTLFELLVTVAILSLLIGPLASWYAFTGSTEVRAEESKQDVNNRLVRQGLMDTTAAKSNPLGNLPSPYTGGGYISTVFNPADATNAGIEVASILANQGMAATQINDDGSAGANVRVYQLVSGLVYQTPLLGTSGPLVTLRYQFGAVYLTACGKADSTCNPNPATGLPGASAVMTTANYKTWSTTYPDSPAVFASSWPQQMAKLDDTGTTLTLLTNALRKEFNDLQIMSAAGDATNFFPRASTSQSGKDPSANQGCRDGWYSLKNSDLLQRIQMSNLQSGSTKWGGDIQFCRDYDPTGTKGADTVPHKAALRVLSDLSLGLDPDNLDASKNVFITL